jgi:hypothetical protein
MDLSDELLDVANVRNRAGINRGGHAYGVSTLAVSDLGEGAAAAVREAAAPLVARAIPVMERQIDVAGRRDGRARRGGA